MACSTPSTRSHSSATAARTVSRWEGSETSSSNTFGTGGSLRAVRSVSDSPRPAPVRMTSAPFLLGQLGDAERERRVGEHAGDDDALALQQTHGAAP